MIKSMLRSMFGSFNDREVKALQETVDAINLLEDEISKLTDANLRAKTQEFKDRISNGETIDDILVESFAVVREGSKRSIGLRHYDVQLLGGVILQNGNIAEMRTGEGKTLVATAPVYLNALTGNGVHVVTVNEYLANRDAKWMGEVYSFLGLTTGVVVPNMNDDERKDAYACDITYATNNELGFDFLRDNLRLSLDEIVQRGHNFAIVDEVDSILIDEARTPLIISGPAEDSSDLYITVNEIIVNLDSKFVEIDEKSKNATLTEDGLVEIEVILEEKGLLKDGTLYDNQNISLLHHINQSIKAIFAFNVEKDYIVENGEVIIVDEFSGRKMKGRRYSEGLHQAIEAKEGVEIAAENQTLASITFQNYFRMYGTLSGMTGTAMTEAGEFEEIYNLKCIEVPTNVKEGRIDYDDDVFRTSDERDDAVVEQVKICVKKGQPILLGTASIEQSEHFSTKLDSAGVKHNMLNAKNHEKEADIILGAGLRGAVTIATNMAGRGTDIKLGGENATDKEREKILSVGGLFVLGTERHESRRIDNQLRGRSGRQGDVGETKFFLSLEDDLMRIFGSERIDGLLRKMGLERGEPITHPWVSRALEKAQQKVEGHNFEIRKQLIKYDDVTNEQRHAMFKLRKEYMTDADVFATANEIRYQMLEYTISSAIPEKSLPNQWDLEKLKVDCQMLFAVNVPIEDWINEDGVDDQIIFSRIKDFTDKHMQQMRSIDDTAMREVTVSIMVQILDSAWKEHLYQMDHLRQGIGLRAYGQKDPLNEYKSEAYTLYEDFLHQASTLTTQYLSHLKIEEQEDKTPALGVGVSRNSSCSCGSGKKYKHCCGKI